MPPTTIHTEPKIDDYTALVDHQSATPTTFYDARPVLHYTGNNFRAIAPKDQVSHLKIFDGSADVAPILEHDNGTERPLREEAVAIFISSENLTLWNPRHQIGISIPYPSISLHAIQRLPDPTNTANQVQSLYMQLELSSPSPSSDDEEPEIVELNLIPQSSDTDVETKAVFEAVSACSNLHPDLDADGDEDMDDDRIVFEGNVGYEGVSGLPGVQQGVVDGGLPPPFPGSGGWITAENVGEYFDEEGNWIGGGGNHEVEVLGEGAGRIRGRDEVDGEVNGDGHEEDESKWRRTE